MPDPALGPSAIHPALGHVKDTGTPKGRGVFASRAIEEGEVIEVCPVVPLATPYAELPAELQRMVFDWQTLARMPGASVLALGYGSLYNHANPANARYAPGPDRLTLVVTACSPISQGAEITLNYNATQGAPVSIADNWFAATGVTPLAP
ncbi:MAG: SET domain-containing protein-lysine N-methyltransferase [Burkholderiales bacterium]|nr:SET domain-containing protein-lysine N-methyltransferase [Burkholderiales bacterium]